jgi:hypothetical protein
MRFLPFIQVHEFEALLFSEPSAFAAAFPGRESAIRNLVNVRTSFPSPEHIDDRDNPASRICAVFPDYQKPVDGALVARRIGLEKMARECAHFSEWLERLRRLAE